ncbi:Yop proteins translocation protein K [Roseiconus lacunae]|nr:Yop proteins translocation protein K [Roseiconus lacunae]
MEFNHNVFEYVHQDWLNGWISHQTYQRLASSRRGRGYLRQVFFDRFKLEPQGVYDFRASATRFSLLHPAELETLCLRLGMARYHRIFSRIIKRSERDKVKQLLGQDAYQFVTRRAALMVAPAMELNERGVDELDRTYLSQVGWSTLAGLIDGRQDRWRRTRLKLPPAVTVSNDSTNFIPQPHAYALAYRILTNTIDSKWTHVFNS